MGDRVLLLRKSLAKRAFESENLRKEQGIVAESVSPLRLMGYTALDRPSGIVLPTLLIKVYQMTNEESEPFPERAGPAHQRGPGTSP